MLEETDMRQAQTIGRQVERESHDQAGDPDPAPPAAPIAMPIPTAACPDCDGTGVKKMSTGGHLDAWVIVDCRCQRVAAA